MPVLFRFDHKVWRASTSVNNCHSNDGCPTDDLLSESNSLVMASKLRSVRLFRLPVDWQRECFPQEA